MGEHSFDPLNWSLVVRLISPNPALLVWLISLGSGCAQLDVGAESLCVTAAAHLDRCGIEVPIADLDTCDAPLARAVIAADCSTLPMVLENDLDPSIALKDGDGWRRGDGFLCRLGFMTRCADSACLPDEDIEPPSRDDDCIEWTRYSGCAACEYYRCREAKAQCGANGYLLGYVGKYCDRFSTVTEPRLSEAGAQWMADVRACLIEELDQQTDESNTCDEIAAIGVASHSSCYLQSGFCDLSFTDWFAIIHTIDAFDIPFQQILATGHGCLQAWF